MLFNSLQFLIFFIIFFSVYVLLRHANQNRLLILFSCIFYGSWNWKFLVLMFISISIDYFCAKSIDSSNDAFKRKVLLALSICINLSFLFFFKYFNFLSQNISSVLSTLNILPSQVAFVLNFALPVGISFYTFEAISYVVDVYYKRTRPAQNYWDYVLFIVYFPHLIAGPIMRAKDFLPQVSMRRSLSLSNFYEGSYLFFWGLFEKMFVADNMGKIVNTVFAGPTYEGGVVLIALYAFAFQIFCDFDGYTNMARGLAKMMGFELTINFNLPYFAISPKDFWQRWHISLSSWLRDYVYIPLGGGRQGVVRSMACVLLTMTIGGIWHGASWNFLLWGLYHGILILIFRYVPDFKSRGLTMAYCLRAFVFFHLVVLGWLFFRATDFMQIAAMLNALFMNFHLTHATVLLFLKFAAIVCPLLIIQIFQFKSGDLLFLFKCRWIIKTVVYAFMFYLIVGFGVMKAEQFIYFQF